MAEGGIMLEQVKAPKYNVLDMETSGVKDCYGRVCWPLKMQLQVSFYWNPVIVIGGEIAVILWVCSQIILGWQCKLFKSVGEALVTNFSFHFPFQANNDHNLPKTGKMLKLQSHDIDWWMLCKKIVFRYCRNLRHPEISSHNLLVYWLILKI